MELCLEETFENRQLLKKQSKNELNRRNANVYEIVPYINQTCISVRWVYSLKEVDKGPVPKAHLVPTDLKKTIKTL